MKTENTLDFFFFLKNSKVLGTLFAKGTFLLLLVTEFKLYLWLDEGIGQEFVQGFKKCEKMEVFSSCSKQLYVDSFGTYLCITHLFHTLYTGQPV